MKHNVMGIDPCDGENHEIFNTTSQKRNFVDARTGLFEAFVLLPTIHCNSGMGPAIDMSLSYTPMINNMAGLGDGWSFAFTTYNEHTRQLRLHSGEAVHLPEEGPLRSNSVIAYWNDDKTTLTVKRTQGNVEVLKRVGESSFFTPTRLSTDGTHFATLSWKEEQHEVDGKHYSQVKLTAIRDEAEPGKASPSVTHVEIKYIKVSFNENQVVINFWKQVESEACSYDLVVKEFALTQVTIPEGDRYQFKYLGHEKCGWLLNDVLTPAGLHEEVTYKDNGLPFPKNSKLSALPCVHVHTVTPASGASKVLTEYGYAVSDNKALGLQDLLRLKKREVPGMSESDYRTLEGFRAPSLAKDPFGALSLAENPKDLDPAVLEHIYLSLLSAGKLDLFQRPYETTVTCGHRVEKITYDADHQVVNASVSGEGGRKSNRRYVVGHDNILVVEDFLIEGSEYLASGYAGQALTENFQFGGAVADHVRCARQEESTFKGDLLYERTALGNTHNWEYEKEGHTSEADKKGGYVFSLARVNSETITYPDGTKTQDSFTYASGDSRPATRKESLFNGEEIEHLYTYGERGLSCLEIKQPGQVQSHKKTITHTVSATEITRQVVEQIGEQKRSTSQTYSPFNGRLLKETDADGNLSTFTYDKQGRLLSHTTCAQNSTFMASTHYSYPSATRMEVVEPNGLRRAYLYDGRGNVVEEYLAPPASQDEKAVPWKLMLKEDYDDQGRKCATKRYDYLPMGKQEHTVIQGCEYRYDVWGAETERALDTGEVFVDYHNPVSNVRVERQGARGGLEGKYSFYNNKETIDRIEWRNSEGDVVKAERFSYMRAGLVHRHAVVERDRAYRVTFAYDKINRCLSEQYDYFSPETFKETDTLNQRANALLDPKPLYLSSAVKKRQFEYSTDLFVTEPSRVLEGGQVVGEREFDAFGRASSITRNGFKETYTYDGACAQPTTKTTADGKTLNYTYYKELGNRVASVHEATSKLKQTFTYATPVTSMAETVEGERRTRFTYDDQGRVSHYEAQLKAEAAASAKNPKVDAVKKAVTYTRSVGGRLLVEEDAGGGSTEFSYDEHGRCSMASHRHAGGAEQSQLEFGYDASGKLASETLSLGKAMGKASKGTFKHEVKLAYGYDQAQREVLRTFTTPQGIFEVTRAYDEVGRLIETHLKQEGKALGSRLLAYDVNGKLESCETTGVWRPTTLKNEAIDKQAFEYDPQGNLIKCVTSFGSTTCTSNFSYAGTRLLEVKHSHPGLGKDAQLTYDKAGRVTKDQSGKTYTYDALGRLTQCGSKHYLYDAMNRLMANGDGADQRQVIYDDLTVRGEYGADADQMRHCCLEGAGLAVMRLVKSDVQRTLVQLRDLAGTVLLTCDLVANTSLHHAYTAYGSRASTDSDALTGFNGEYRDADNDQYPLGNGYRWYAPDAMRFHRQDDASPFGEGGCNAYEYCDGDPVNKQDPTGHFGIFAALIVIVGSFFITYAASLLLTHTLGEKAASTIIAGLWAGLGVITAIATGGLSLWAYAAVVALSVVAFSTAVAAAVLDGIDDTASNILGWVCLATTVAAGVIGAASKAAKLAAEGLKKLSDQLGKRSSRCLNHLAGKRPVRQLNMNIETGKGSHWRYGSGTSQPRASSSRLPANAGSTLPESNPGSGWREALGAFDSSDVNTLVCTTTGILGNANVFDDDPAYVNGQLNNETWLPWGNWKRFGKLYRLQR